MNQNKDRASYMRGVRHTRNIEYNFWQNFIINTLGLLLAWAISPEITCTNIFAFIGLVILIWFLNWIIRPIIVLFTLPFIILTMGVGMLFINAFIIYLAAGIVPEISVGSYWSALFASFLISVISWGLAMSKSEKIMRDVINKNGNSQIKKDDDDTIDV